MGVCTSQSRPISLTTSESYSPLTLIAPVRTSLGHQVTDLGWSLVRELSIMISTQGLVGISQDLVTSGRANCVFTPGPSLSSYGEMLAKREIYRIQNVPRRNSSPIYYGTASEQIWLLQTAVTAMRSLEAYTLLARSSQPRLWHTDLHMGNIFVSEQDPSRILSFIDWQSTQVAPTFLQARWPEFVTPPKGYKTGFTQPELPDNYDQLNPEDQEIEKYKWGLANRTKAYEVSNFLNDQIHHDAMNVPRVFRELFLRCGETWDVGCVPLRACLIELSTSWGDLKLPGTCPFSFQKDELYAHEDQFREYQEWLKVRDFAKEYLSTDDEGWISPELDFAEMRIRNRNLLNLFVEQMAGERSPEEARKMWPFPEES